MKVVQGNQVVLTARTLDAYADVDHVTAVVVDGQCTVRRDRSPVIAATQGEYFHGTLVVDSNGMVDFKPLPYRCDPYPMYDIIFGDAFECVAEGKIWAITKDTQGKCYVMYKNDSTLGRFVYQNVTNNISYDDRIKSKLAKGYVATKTLRFFANARKVTSI